MHQRATLPKRRCLACAKPFLPYAQWEVTCSLDCRLQRLQDCAKYGHDLPGVLFEELPPYPHRVGWWEFGAAGV